MFKLLVVEHLQIHKKLWMTKKLRGRGEKEKLGLLAPQAVNNQVLVQEKKIQIAKLFAVLRVHLSVRVGNVQIVYHPSRQIWRARVKQQVLLADNYVRRSRQVFV
tara:strand:+ start:29 stop:343 length:315 start_codon:yes stop_codon:yes gene_type:complete